MAKPPHSIYGRVHCATLIKFSKKEEDAMLKEYHRPSIARPEKSEKSNWRSSLW